MKIKRFLIGSSIVLLLYSVYVCFCWALADILATQVKYRLEQGDMKLDAWKLSVSFLNDALKLNPQNAGYLELAEHFYRNLDNQPKALQDQLGLENNAQKALDYARQSLSMTPSWPYLWDRLAADKLNLKQFDSELSGAIERASTLAGWDEVVQYDAAVIGLYDWDKLDGAVQEKVVKAIRRSFEIQENAKQQKRGLKTDIHWLCHNLSHQASPQLNRLADSDVCISLK